MSMLSGAVLELDLVASPRRDTTVREVGTETILSFDIEEHDRIEAAARLVIDPELRARYHDRVAPMTRWLIEQLDRRGLKATFFVVGQFARSEPALVRSIHEAGHEVASHGWDHRSLFAMSAADFRDDVRKSRDALEQIIGNAVLGYRAPTFSVVPRTAWAIDVLAEEGLLYDSSIFPVHHDRYGVPQAPRTPFLAEGMEHAILEFPPATLRHFGSNLPAGGGGYFRLLPLAVMERAIEQIHRKCRPAVTMLYFHPWEFDPDQPKLPLPRLSRFRTYVGIRHTRSRLVNLLDRYQFTRAVDVAHRLNDEPSLLPRHTLVPSAAPRLPRVLRAQTLA